jgi:hypothetical protein
VVPLSPTRRKLQRWAELVQGVRDRAPCRGAPFVIAWLFGRLKAGHPKTDPMPFTTVLFRAWPTRRITFPNESGGGRTHILTMLHRHDALHRSGGFGAGYSSLSCL